MNNWWATEFDKLLLFMALMLAGGVVIWAVQTHVDREVVAWSTRVFDNLQGAFLMLLTGSAAALARRAIKPEPPEK